MNASTRLTVFLLVGLAGCNTQEIELGSATTSLTGPVASEFPSDLMLNDCKGIKTHYYFFGDTAPVGEEVPPGWEETDPVRAAVGHDTIILQCSRLSFGPFERGPIHVLLESHSGARVPPQCLKYESATPYAEILRGIWFDDPEVAGHFASQWSMPVHVGMFANEETTQGGRSIRRWIWNEEGGQLSELHYAPTETSDSSPGRHRYFWHDQASVFMLDLTMDGRAAPLGSGVPIAGWFRPPMMPIEPYIDATSGLVNAGAFFAGTFHHFRDLQCNES